MHRPGGSISGKVALITGASRGIGRAIAVMLARQQVHCILIARDVGKLQEVASLCAAEGTPARVMACDLLDHAQCRKTIQDAARPSAANAPQGIDFVINNAGVYKSRPFGGGEAADDDRMIDTNVKGMLHVCRHALPYLAQSQQAAIVNISSIAGVRTVAGEAVYVASKHAMMGFTGALFEEVRERGIKVSAVCPGIVATQMAENRGVNLTRALQPEDVADAVNYVLHASLVACPTQILLEPQRDPLHVAR